VTRTVPAAAERAPTQPLGEAGIWVFVIGDMTVFALFFAVLMYTRGHEPAVFLSGRRSLSRDLGVVNTLLLLTSSLLVAAGLRGTRQPGPARGRALPFLGALGCGICFVAVKVVEWSRELRAGHTPGTNDFYQYYFMYTGIHLLHVFIGMVLLVRMALASRTAAFGQRERRLAETGAVFWHMVDLLWLMLFALFYLMPGRTR
jgi:nitric oxide reductase NorE protein